MAGDDVEWPDLAGVEWNGLARRILAGMEWVQR